MANSATAQYEGKLKMVEEAFAAGRIPKAKRDELASALLDHLVDAPLHAPNAPTTSTLASDDPSGNGMSVARASRKPWQLMDDAPEFDTLDEAKEWIKDSTNHDGVVYTYLFSGRKDF